MALFILPSMKVEQVQEASGYDSKLRELTQEKLELYNERAKFIEENEEVK